MPELRKIKWQDLGRICILFIDAFTRMLLKNDESKIRLFVVYFHFSKLFDPELGSIYISLTQFG